MIAVIPSVSHWPVDKCPPWSNPVGTGILPITLIPSKHLGAIGISSSACRVVAQRRQWQPTPVLMPGKPHERRSLVGCSPWGHEEWDRTEWLNWTDWGVPEYKGFGAGSLKTSILAPDLLLTCSVPWKGYLTSWNFWFLLSNGHQYHYPTCYKIALRLQWTAAAAAAAAAKSLQLCLTLWDPIDCSLPGSSVPGILQARILEWVAISFSNAWKGKGKVKLLSHVQLLVTPWTAAYQAPASMGFTRQEYWSGLPVPSPSSGLGLANNQDLKFFLAGRGLY